MVVGKFDIALVKIQALKSAFKVHRSFENQAVMNGHVHCELAEHASLRKARELLYRG